MASPELRKLYPWFIVSGLFIGALVILAFYQDQFPEWKEWQHAYIKQEMSRVAMLQIGTPVSVLKDGQEIAVVMFSGD